MLNEQSRSHISIAAVLDMSLEQQALHLAALGLLLGFNFVERKLQGVNVSGSAAQLMATNGPCRRGLSACSVRATISLPVPLSPVISTHALLGPACCSSAKISCIRGAVPTMSPSDPL